MAWKRTVHAYDEHGKPHFNVTLAEAKKANLLLSVTEIQKVEAKPALEAWKLNEHIKTCLKNPPLENEEPYNYIKRIKATTFQNSGGAAALGTDVHAATEAVLGGEKTVEDLDSEIRKYVIPAQRYFKEKGFEILDLEKTVVNLKVGYGGTMDCSAKAPGGQLFCLDWKTTKTKGRSGLPYQGQPEQVAAYAAAYFGEDKVAEEQIWGANAYISTDEVDADGHAKFKVVSYTPKELAKHWETFQVVADLWRRRERYDPRRL